MITVTFVTSGLAAETFSLQCETGQSLMQAALDAGIAGIEADCGGILNCATCHVYVREPHVRRLAPAGGSEQDMLEFTTSPRRNASRLSCQIELTEELDDITVEIPESQT